MIPLFPLVAIQIPNLPSPASLRRLVVVTRDPRPEDNILASGGSTSIPDPKQLGKWTVLDPVQSRAQLLVRRGYVVRDAGPFLLAAPPDLLGVPQARKETSLLREIARRTAAGDRVLAIKDLPKEEAQTLRGKLAPYQEPHNLRVKNAPYLRFGVETWGVFDVQSGRLRTQLELLPGTGLGSKESKSREAAIMRPDAEDAAAAIRPAGPPLDPRAPLHDTASVHEATSKERIPAPIPRGRLTFIVPTGLPGDQGLEWMGISQAILLKEAREARANWTEARDALLEALKKEEEAPFTHPPKSGSVPTFNDLTPDAQANAAQYFGSVYRNELKGQNAMDWLRDANFLTYHVEPVLTMKVAAGTGWYTNLVQFACPVGP